MTTHAHSHHASHVPIVHHVTHGGRSLHVVRAPVEIASWANVWPELPQGCTPDTSNPNARALAQSIAQTDQPVAWIDRGEYAVTIDGTIFVFVMWRSQPGRKDVSIYSCGPSANAAALAQVTRGGIMGTPYSANVECPCPPCESGWEVVDPAFAEAQDLVFKARAAELLEVLPAWSMCDEQTGTGLYRWFAFEHACGTAVGAMKYTGSSGHYPDVGAMGLDDPNSCPSGDVLINGVCVPADAPNPKNWSAPATPGESRGAGEEGGQDGAITDTPQDLPKAPNGAPLWGPDGTCDAWQPDASNVKATQLANEILWTPGSPSWPSGKRGTGKVPPWVAGSTYHTTIDGVAWKFPMYTAGGLQYVSALRCTSPKKSPVKPPALTISSSALWIVLALLAVVGGGAAIAMQHKKHERKAA